MKAIEQELYLQGDDYVKISHGLTLDRAEEVQLKIRNDNKLAIVRHYNDEWYVFLRKQ